VRRFGIDRWIGLLLLVGLGVAALLR